MRNIHSLPVVARSLGKSLLLKAGGNAAKGAGEHRQRKGSLLVMRVGNAFVRCGRLFPSFSFVLFPPLPLSPVWVPAPILCGWDGKPYE